MNAQGFTRWSGFAAMAAGVLNVLSALSDPVPELVLYWIRKSADTTALIGLLGVYVYQRDAASKLGLVALVIAGAGIAMLLLDLYYGTAIGVYALGLVLMSVEILRAHRFPRWVAGFWLASPLIGALGAIVPQLRAPAGFVAALAFASGFFEAGRTMAFSSNSRPPTNR